MFIYPRETPPHIRTARASPQRHTAAGTAAPTTADTGNTVPQCVNPTQMTHTKSFPSNLDLDQSGVSEKLRVNS